LVLTENRFLITRSQALVGNAIGGEAPASSGENAEDLERKKKDYLYVKRNDFIDHYFYIMRMFRFE